jgi:hypothetical protein
MSRAATPPPRGRRSLLEAQAEQVEDAADRRLAERDAGQPASRYRADEGIQGTRPGYVNERQAGQVHQRRGSRAAAGQPHRVLDDESATTTMSRAMPTHCPQAARLHLLQEIASPGRPVDGRHLVMLASPPPVLFGVPEPAGRQLLMAIGGRLVRVGRAQVGRQRPHTRGGGMYPGLLRALRGLSGRTQRGPARPFPPGQFLAALRQLQRALPQFIDAQPRPGQLVLTLPQLTARGEAGWWSR